MSQDTINKIHVATGLEFPLTSEEIDLFNEIYKDHVFKADASQIDPVKILASTRQKPVKVNGVEYHKRTVLAAEIVFQLHPDWTFGHLKLQKLIYMCQHINEMAIYTNFLKQAMGPYDNKLMRSIDSQFKKNLWFEYQPQANQKYKPLAKVGGHKEWYERYFSSQMEDIQWIIDTFRPLKTADTEIIATVYACWKELLVTGQGVSEHDLIKNFYGWSDHKKEFTELQIRNAISWMQEKGIFPQS